MKKKKTREFNLIAFALLPWHVPSCFSKELLFQRMASNGATVSTQPENYRAPFGIIKNGPGGNCMFRL